MELERATPLVSVLLPVYNGERFLGEAIDSMLAQTFTDFELIIVNDGSTDGTARIISEYAARDGRILPLRHASNRGQASALNSGLAEARGDCIAGMDADDISLPERLGKQADYLQAHPDIGAIGIGGRIVDADLRKLDSQTYPQDHAQIVLNLFLGMKSFLGAGAMVRRKLLLAVGGYDPSALVRDWELWSRLASTTRFANMPGELYLYRQHDASMTATLNPQLTENWHAIQAAWLDRLWGSAPASSLRRFRRVSKGRKLPWPDRRWLRRDLSRLLDALTDSGALEPADRPQLRAECDRLVRSAAPRLWLRFLFWRRYRLGF